MLHLLQRFKIAMDRHRSKLLIMNTKQRFECSPFRVCKSPLATPLCPRNALVECEIRGAIQFRFAVGTQIEREREHIGQRGDRLNIATAAAKQCKCEVVFERKTTDLVNRKR
ncbi:hypothetical protein WL99_16005 [Burkholderia cepacia]|nr:hypothetical protein WK01_34890 [Burkholderia cepacia]KVQ62280.1 hypothetical protein WT23_18485 [Burkholderia territorii]KVW15620.1 hypothetical protein WK91_17465 [Burkholderia cepacia]KVZ97257.1 hypothetical protein WL26_37410 [Burkholderia cepacia]KWH29246.1 hypothetical protein WL99_16005 [Burkholderia cepacia]